jgi:predicted HTH transcriptional regulator
MKPQGIDRNIQQLNKVARRIIHEMGENKDDKDSPTVSSEDTVEEMKRIIVNLLSGVEMSTPELRKYFKLSNSQIWKVMADLENSRMVKRARKQGRTILWTAN